MRVVLVITLLVDLCGSVSFAQVATAPKRGPAPATVAQLAAPSQVNLGGSRKAPTGGKRSDDGSTANPADGAVKAEASAAQSQSTVPDASEERRLFSANARASRNSNRSLAGDSATEANRYLPVVAAVGLFGLVTGMLGRNKKAA
jgi:hypothetical protein